MHIILEILAECWRLLAEASIYIIFGLLVAGLLKAFLSPNFVSRNLGQGKVGPVFKAALFGLPLPLCSCGVLPAAAGLKRQGAGRGAVASFLVSTPETGVDSIALTYALLGPVMAIARPLAAIITALVTGLGMGVLKDKQEQASAPADRTCPVDACCDGVDCAPEAHAHHHSLWQRFGAGLSYARGDLWEDLAAWFWLGIILAGVIAALVPEDFLARYLGGGMGSMLIMLAVGIPLYICASASTPIAAALILKGVSPGAALVFLLAGPATNVTSLTVLVGVLGKRGTALYLVGIALGAVASGLLLDQFFALSGLSPLAVAGAAGEILPDWLRQAGAGFLVLLSIAPLWRLAVRKLGRKRPEVQSLDSLTPVSSCGSSSCGCSHSH
ncbi:MAG: SO_0444 family Cu/Zn efflux transporter [Desulfarculaceae bacterium]|nr:SO_0444 family Cu/Zn efflux transporter [Desulfarculaceae bacterium]MCF8048224.1 SO_0444 family Cu/Zn efflux transporter [Desulfarculaceae bacterium]MCF8097847.1 SO_0444 family Cu/Zn efflux transporter [Desulfarculaceae bacterium]MCF8122811.1 SO_0444 family Cu/Zn efflux transporter [Desulfarculaceae bacterium]